MNADTLLKQANLLGTQASNQTGVAFTPINSSSLTPTAPITLPSTPNVDTTNHAVISTTQAPVVDQTTTDINNAKADVAATKSTTAQIVDSLKQKFGLVSDAQTQAATVTPEETKQVKDLADINTEIANQQVAYRGETDAIKARGDITKEGQAGLQSNIDSKYGRSLADLAIRQSAANGNLTALRSAADRKLALTLAPLETQIKYLSDVALANENNLSKDAKEQLNSLLAKKQKEKDDITAKQKAIADLLGKALENGVKIPDNLVSQVTSAPDIASATAILARNGISLQNPLDNELKRSQIAENNAQIAKINSEAAQLAGTTGGKSEDLTAYASNFADTGKLPTPAELKLSGLSVGQVTAMAKQLPKPNGALVSTNTGVKSSALSPTEEQGITALSEIVRTTLPTLKTTFDKLDAGLLGRVGAVVYTTQDRQDYRTLRADFLAKLLVARSGGAVTEQEYQRYSDLVPSELGNAFLGGISDRGGKTLNSLEKSMKSTLDNQLDTKQQSIYGYSKVKVNGVDRTVGEVLDIGGQKYKVLPDGTLTDII